MRVLMIAHGHPEMYPGGAEIVAQSLSRALRRTPGVESRFLAVLRPGDTAAHAGTGFASYDGNSDESLFTAGGINDFFISQHSIEYLTSPFAEFLRSYRPDVVHFQHIMNIGVEALRATRTVLPDCVIAYTFHEYVPICHRQGQMLRTDGSLCDRSGSKRCNECFPKIEPNEFFLRELYLKSHFELVDGFICPSRFLLSRYEQWGIDPRKLAFLENGHPLARQSRPELVGMRSRVPTFAFFGQINPFKGIFTLLDAVEWLLTVGVTQFVVRVHGTEQRQSKEFKRKYAAAVRRVQGHQAYGGQLQLMGPYSGAETIDRMRESDAIIVPSVWWENSPLVIQEAFIARRPVICSDIGGMAEKVRHGVDGLHFRVQDSVALAETLRQCIENPAKLGELSSFPQILSAEDSARQHVDYYSTLGENRKTSAAPLPLARALSH